MTKRCFCLVCCVIFGVFVGVCASGQENQEKVYNAIVIDRQDITSRVVNIEYKPDYLNEQTVRPNTLYGWRGHATITIPWPDIRRIDFFDGDARFNTEVTLRDKRHVFLKVEAPGTMYRGTNDYGGIFSIQTEFIRTIAFE
jgi:hypothetical protein